MHGVMYDTITEVIQTVMQTITIECYVLQNSNADCNAEC